MKTKIFILLACIQQSVFAQQTIKVQPQHQKEHIYTLRENESLGYRESKVLVKTNGVTYEFVTERKNLLYMHKKGKSPKAISRSPYGFIDVTYNEEGKITLKNTKTGKSYGPYESATPLYNRQKKELYAIKYWENNQQFLLADNKIIGPYDNIKYYFGNSKVTSYTFYKDKQWFIYKNGEVSGPFEDCGYKRQNVDNPGIFSYKKDNKWYVMSPHFETLIFCESPHLHFNVKANEWEVYGKLADEKNINYCIKQNGTKIESSFERFTVENTTNETLHFERIRGNKNSRSSNLYQVTYKDSIIGTFMPKHRVRSNSYETDYFGTSLVEADTSTRYTHALKDRNFLFSPSKGLVGPIPDRFIYSLMFFDNSCAFVNTRDSTLVVDNKVVADKVIAADYYDYPEAWWVLKAEGYVHQPYKNGKKVSSGIPERLKNYNTPDKDFIVVKRENQYFLRPKNSNNLLGPVSRYSQYAVASDKTTYAEGGAGKNTIMINGKVISKGFNLTYNQYQDTFHWFSLDENNRLYLHTYLND